MPLPEPEPPVEEEPAVAPPPVIVEKENKGAIIWFTMIILTILLILTGFGVFLLRQKFHKREHAKTFVHKNQDKSADLILIQGAADDSDVEIGGKKKLVGDDSERHQLQVDGDDEKPQKAVSKYGIIYENDFAQSQADTDRNERAEDKTIAPESTTAVHDADTQTPGTTTAILEEDQSRKSKRRKPKDNRASRKGIKEARGRSPLSSEQEA